MTTLSKILSSLSSSSVAVHRDAAGKASVPRTSCAASPNNVSLPAANTAAVITYAATGATCHVLGGIAYSYAGGTPSGGNLKIEDGSGNTVFSQDLAAAGPGVVSFSPPLRGSSNTALIVTLAAAGSGLTGKLSVLGKATENA